MFLAGSNFVLSYYAFKGKVQKVLRDEEFKYYTGFVVCFTIVAALVVYFKANVSTSEYYPMVFGEGESAFRHALFQVLTVITTTGFVTADVFRWLCRFYGRWY